MPNAPSSQFSTSRTSISPGVLLGRKTVAGGRREEGSEAETAASRSGGRAGPQWGWAEVEALALAASHPFPVCGCVRFNFLPQLSPSNATVQRPGSASQLKETTEVTWANYSPKSSVGFSQSICPRGLPGSGQVFPGGRSSPPPEAVSLFFERKKLNQATLMRQA